MAIFVVAYVDPYDNKVFLEKIEASDEMEALRKHTKIQVWDFGGCATPQQVKELLSGGDYMVETIQV